MSTLFSVTICIITQNKPQVVSQQTYDLEQLADFYGLVSLVGEQNEHGLEDDFHV